MPGTGSNSSIQSGGGARHKIVIAGLDSVGVQPTNLAFNAISINQDPIPSDTNAFCGSEVISQIDVRLSFGFGLWLRFGGCFGLCIWCRGFSSKSSLTSTEMIFIIGQVFGRCTNILRDFHTRHCLEGNKTAGAECRHGDIQVLRQRY